MLRFIWHIHEKEMPVIWKVYGFVSDQGEPLCEETKQPYFDSIKKIETCTLKSAAKKLFSWTWKGT